MSERSFGIKIIPGLKAFSVSIIFLEIWSVEATQISCTSIAASARSLSLPSDFSTRYPR